jgi:predicted nucleic acid-binding protein
LKILIDCDVLVDFVQDRLPFSEPASKVLSWTEDHPGQAAIAWHTCANLFYICGSESRLFLQDLIRYVDIAAVATGDFAGALSFQMADLEDAMQAAAALSFGAAFIVTRNVKDYSRSPVKAVSPAEFARRNVT